jgi:putative transposase
MCSMYRRRIRLESDVYRVVDHPCSVTIATSQRRMIFSYQDLAKDIVIMLRMLCSENNVPLYAYCIMPDHAHLLLSASEKMGIIDFMREFKSRSTRAAWKHGLHGSIWQRSFYDHFLGSDEDCRTVADYIVQNPVRKGVVEQWGDYPFSGSLVYDL